MSRIRRRALPAAIGMALGSLAAAPALAAAGWYVSIGGGTTSIDNFDAGAAGDFEGALGDSELTVTVDDLYSDDSDFGLRLSGGWQFNDYFALEGFYADLGSYAVGFSGTLDDGGEGGPLDFAGEAGVDSKGFGVFAVLTYPVGAGFSLLGKAGGMHWDADVPVAVNVDGVLVSGSVGDDGTDFAWGAGLKFHITEQLAVDVQYEQYTTIEDIDMISGNVSWGFW